MSATSILERKQVIAGRILLLPGLAIIGITTVIPLAASFVLSLTEYDLINSPRFAGFKNYQKLFSDPEFLKSITNTFYFAIGQVVIGVVVALLIAALFARRERGDGIARTIVYLPQAMSYVVVALVWSFLLDPVTGPLNAISSALRGPSWNFLTEPSLAMPTIIGVSLWRNLGYFSVILLAGLQAVPVELIEASQIDGAKRIGRWRYVILPQMKNPLLFVVITWLMGGMQMFTQSYVMTQGGPLGRTRTIVYHMYDAAFFGLDVGTACAVAALMFMFVVVVALPIRLVPMLRKGLNRGSA